MKFLDTDQLNRLLEVYKEPAKRLLIRLLAFTGCRISEVLAIRIKDIDYKGRCIEVPALKFKHRETKLVIVDQFTLDLIKIFVRGKPGDTKVLPYNRFQAWHIIRAAGRAIGIPNLHPHTLRHTFAVQWLRGGGDIHRLQRQLGHKKLATTTDLYIHFSMHDLAEDYDKVFKGR